MTQQTNRRGKVTRQDVAREAGTSVAVVSYVVNDGPRPVAPATKQRVLDAIERIGYRPNGIASALARGTTRTFGFVVPNISNPFVASIAHQVEREVFDQDCVLLLGDSADDAAREAALVRNLLDRQVDGLLYMAVTQDVQLDRATASGTPVVVVTHANSDGLTASVRIDERAAADAAMTHLIDVHGQRELAMVTGPESMMNSALRLGGARDAATRAGLTIPDEWTVHAPYTREAGSAAAAVLFGDGGAHPTAVLTGNQEQAIGLVSALHRRGLSVPEDVAVFCLNGTDDSEFLVPALSTVTQPIAEMAREALRILSRPDHYAAEPIVFDFELVPRESCGCGGSA
ncbi:LacI family DNA-binding transcriptional regulator [Flexivirga meconopsidis]|uniref:LacI family DNA-binding transcriptional regulator n=1 Tax=Flexivirga meconopsidis TaxID=2977121 RepID=UPI0022408A31|nr:LacI family DNA-binding transcriptional regulator [Flexivirga meconopsidis]